MALDIVLTSTLVVAAVVTVVIARVLWAAIALALASAVLSIVMFHLGAPLAAVFELSVCAGLIPAIFISAISLTQRLTPETLAERRKEKFKRFGLLPVIVILVGLAMTQVHIPLNFAPAPGATDVDVRVVLWNLRHIDLLGQVVVLLGGVFAVVVLVKEFRHES